MWGLLTGEFFDELVQFLEARVPELPVAFEPTVKLAKRLCAQLVEPLLSARLDVHERLGSASAANVSITALNMPLREYARQGILTFLSFGLSGWLRAVSRWLIGDR
jgi:hypothetical protein